MKYLLTLLLIFSPMTYAGDKPPPVVINNDNDNGDNNILPILGVIAIGICVYHKCWKSEVQDKEPNQITPDNLSDRPKVRLQ